MPSSIPARTPIIQASPRTPPPPSTSTSGRERMAFQASGALAADFANRAPAAPQRCGAPYAITYTRMTPAETAQNGVGPRVRALREAMDLSLRDLAERSGVSAPMLSQVERGETSPTLQVAKRIATGLELRLSQLLEFDEDGAVSVVRAGERRKGPSSVEGHNYEILTPPLPGQRAELSRHTLAPGAVTGGRGDPPMHEPGSRETALVERGRVVLHCDSQRYELLDGGYSSRSMQT